MVYLLCRKTISWKLLTQPVWKQLSEKLLLHWLDRLSLKGTVIVSKVRELGLGSIESFFSFQNRWAKRLLIVSIKRPLVNFTILILYWNGYCKQNVKKKIGKLKYCMTIYCESCSVSNMDIIVPHIVAVRACMADNVIVKRNKTGDHNNRTRVLLARTSWSVVSVFFPLR